MLRFTYVQNKNTNSKYPPSARDQDPLSQEPPALAHGNNTQTGSAFEGRSAISRTTLVSSASLGVMAP
ncbi:hypothetical protein V6Z98_006818 [Aspergillus fumigatus]